MTHNEQARVTTAVLWKADQPDHYGRVFPKAVLQRLAQDEPGRFVFDAQDNALRVLLPAGIEYTVKKTNAEKRREARAQELREAAEAKAEVAKKGAEYKILRSKSVDAVAECVYRLQFREQENHTVFYQVECLLKSLVPCWGTFVLHYEDRHLVFNPLFGLVTENNEVNLTPKEKAAVLELLCGYRHVWAEKDLFRLAKTALVCQPRTRYLNGFLWSWHDEISRRDADDRKDNGKPLRGYGYDDEYYRYVDGASIESKLLRLKGWPESKP
ncbi:MAG: hypothetical protein WC505_05890 [Patescibacteria group bacterium]